MLWIAFVTNPLLDAIALPRFSEISPDLIAPALDEAIHAHEEAVAAVTQARPRDFAEAWLPLERADRVLDALWSTVSHLHAVADTPELRAAHAEGQARLVENAMKVAQNHDLYEVLDGLSAVPGFDALPEADRAAVAHAIRDFRLAGVALPPEKRARFAEISVELSGLSNDFASAVLDATDAWEEHVTDEALLAGISDADKAMFADAARARDLDGWLVTLQYPSVTAILTFAEDRGLRARVYEAFNTRASDRGPHAGRFDNSARIARILELRRESAALLGFAGPVEWLLATRMANSADEVLHFLRDLAARAKPFAEREMRELRDFAAVELGLEDLQPWDVGFAANRLRQARYAVDEQAIRAYFPVDRVMEGWQTLLRRLFGIRLAERDDVQLYHPDARYCDVVDEDGSTFAGLYLDLHARPGKRGGAWMAQARPRLHDGGVIGVPVAYLVCNFSPRGGETPSLLSHGDVTTLLHETGHCLHHLFTRVDRPSIAGTNGFEWDAVELPSQLMEDFAWDRDVLTAMSGHYRTGEALPVEQFNRLVAARHFQSGMFIVRQIEFGLFDMLLHMGTLGDDPVPVMQAVREEVAVIHPPEWNRFSHSFSHIFAGGYAAGYYSYLWAEVLAADAFERFAEEGLVDRATGDLLREEILSRGATRPAAESFRAFRGRDADPEAMLRRRGLM
nr:M3 family metallopeptidase [Sphingobium jiangsuense]